MPRVLSDLCLLRERHDPQSALPMSTANYLSSLLVYWILGFPIWVFLLVGAVITPTAPVVSTSVVTGKIAEQNLPQRIRDALSAESAASDG